MSYLEDITAINNRLANFDAALRSYERISKNFAAVSDSLNSVYRPALFNHLGVDMTQHFKALQMPFPMASFDTYSSETLRRLCDLPRITFTKINAPIDTLASVLNETISAPINKAMLGNEVFQNMKNTIFSSKNTFSTSFMDNASVICDEEFIDYMEGLDISGNQVELTEDVANKISILTGLPNESCKKKAIFVKYVLPIILTFISIAISIGDLAYNVHHDHLSDKATAEYRQQSIEMQQQILDELEKQTKLLEHSSKE